MRPNPSEGTKNLDSAYPETPITTILTTLRDLILLNKIDSNFEWSSLFSTGTTAYYSTLDSRQ